MPPYEKNKSKSQQRRFFALARDGEIPMAEAIGRARASKGSDLPERVKKEASMHTFGMALMKIAAKNKHIRVMDVLKGTGMGLAGMFGKIS